MDFDEQFNLEHILFQDRTCRTCGIKKSLIEDFYRIRRKTTVSSSYSYECKECTIKRVKESRKSKLKPCQDIYPDW